MNAINLTQFVPKTADLTKRTSWVDFKGVQFQVRYMSKATMMHIADSCMVAGFKKGEGRTRQLNVEAFVKNIAAAIVVDWKCTLEKLSAIMPLNLPEGITPEQMQQPIPLTEENLLLVIREAHELDGFLQDAATDASLFKSPIAEELAKNSKSSQSGT